MENAIVGLLTMYEKRVDLIESFVDGFYSVALESDENFKVFEKEREHLEKELEALLAKNCSIRHKDFRAEMHKVLSSLSVAEEYLSKERSSVMSAVKEYLSSQKKFINEINDQLSALKIGEDFKDLVETFKITCNDKSELLLQRLRGFQERILIYKREQSELNRRLKLLIERGKELKIEDIRRLKGTELSAKRKSEKKLRKEEVNRFLSRLRNERFSSCEARIHKKKEV